jgi:hypothetical protein
MKKTLLLFGFLNVISAAFGQVWRLEGKETNNNKTRFGIRLGISVAKTHLRYDPVFYPDSDEKGARVGIIGGGLVAIRLNKKVVFQPELLLVGKGVKEIRLGYDYNNRVTYIEMPLYLLFKPEGAKGSFFIGGGPAPSFFIGENIFYSGYNYFNKFDLGLNVLAGYELPLGFSLNLQYTHGLLNVSKNESTLPIVKNRCFGLTAGYLF